MRRPPSLYTLLSTIRFFYFLIHSRVLSAKHHEIAFSESIYFHFFILNIRRKKSCIFHFVDDMIQYELPMYTSTSTV